MKKDNNNNNNAKKKSFLNFYKKKFLILLVIIIFFKIILFLINKHYKLNRTTLNIQNISMKKNDFDKNFDYIHYKSDIITGKIIKEANWILSLNEAYLINGIIRKHKPKNCLEIGVAYGGSSVLILNAIKDLSGSYLVSLDLFLTFKQKEVGYIVKQKFPELMDKWKLVTGNMPHKYLEKLNLKFDFLFLDTAHVSPGEFFNLIEALPFLNDNAIIVLHDTMWHLVRAFNSYSKEYAKIMPTQIYLMSSLIGEKILINDDKFNFANIGVVCLEKKQENYYINYFLLLMNIWQYFPPDEQINELRNFIIKYYKNNTLLKIFDTAVKFNRIFSKKFKEDKYILN